MKIRREVQRVKKESYRYGCVMLYIDFDNTFVSESIDSRDLYYDEYGNYGIDEEPHISLLYGLHTNIPNGVISQLINQMRFGDMFLTNVSAFTENGEYDVLKFDVDGEGLVRANELLKKLPHTNDYLIYNPHTTIAFLKKGVIHKYIELFEGMNVEVSPLSIIYSKNSGEKVRYKIRE